MAEKNPQFTPEALGFSPEDEERGKELDKEKDISDLIDRAIEIGRRAADLGHDVLERLKRIAESKGIDLTSVFPPEPPLEEIPKLVPLVHQDAQTGGATDGATVDGANNSEDPLKFIPLVSLRLEEGPPTQDRIARNIIALRTALENSLVRLGHEIDRLKTELPEGADSASIFNHPDSLFSDLSKSYELAAANEIQRIGEFYDDENKLRTYPIDRLQIIFDEYNHPEWKEFVRGLESEPSGGKRCAKCFEMNLTKAAMKARELGIENFTTTLTVSRFKKSHMVIAVGRAVGSRIGVNFLDYDFKKKGGYDKSIELAKKYGLYQQSYCGCEFSLRKN